MTTTYVYPTIEEIQDIEQVMLPRLESNSPCAPVKNVVAWPAAGPSTTIKSAVCARSSCSILPRTRTRIS